MRRLLLAAALAAALGGCWQRDVGRSYYPSGKVKTEATVKNNVLEGPAVSYYESGARKAEAGYRDGVLDGTSTSWSEDGTVLARARFDHGRLVASDAPAAEKAK